MDYLAPLGPVYQAGTLSGNPLAMAAGLAALRLLEEENPYPRLEEMGARLANGLREAAAQAGLSLQVPQVGSMFCLFFAKEPVSHFEQVLASDSERFKTLFHHALDNGVYLPPSPFETCFLSAAHGEEDIDRTLEVLTTGIKRL
tara:strand:- start:1062 stop:1493 length:432 start_codon:yes stop_codon:yes gene_type:complete